jgi:small-conductance mechanosensitive channel
MQILERFDNGDALVALAVMLGTVVALRLLQWFTRRKLTRLAASTSTRWDDHAVTALGKTRFLFLLAMGFYAGSMTLELRPAYAAALQSFAAIALLLQGGAWLNTVLRAVIEERQEQAMEEDPARVSTVSMLGFLARLALWSVVLLLLLDNLGIDITALVAGLGIGGVAVALAVQNILGDLFASLSIVLDKPFVVGDFLVIGDLMGSVEHVGIKTTRVRSLSGEQLVFSNNDLLTSRIRNFGRMRERRVVFTLGVTYQTPRDRLREIPQLIRQAIEAEDNTRFDRSHFSEYGNFSLNFETVYYVLSSDYAEYMDVQQAIYLRIHEAFEQAGIQFAYPTQTLFLQSETDGAQAAHAR